MFGFKQMTTWMETRGISPSYSCWVILGLTVCFFLAAANTMAGWLYVLCGMGIALLIVSGWLTLQNVQGVRMVRQSTAPVTAHASLMLTLEIHNPTRYPKGMMQLHDRISPALGIPQYIAVEAIAPGDRYTWTYTLETTRRGVYRWDQVELRTAAPLGLFWCRRSRSLPVEVVVYPQVLPLLRCPLIDDLQQTSHPRMLQRDLSTHIGSEGSTRSLRPYRWGDPMRLVHWRTSARHNELRIRELERVASGQQCIIALDTRPNWQEEDFEQAVIAALSLYVYAERLYDNVMLWIAPEGFLQGRRSVQEALARVSETSAQKSLLPHTPLIWLTGNPNSLAMLPANSRFVCWPSAPHATPAATVHAGLWLDATQILSEQLQRVL
jgi:uncharacterized protein (DUF58 family)